MLFIDFEDRRRLRVNGTIDQQGEETLVANVAQAYPNCSKYIRQRRIGDSGPSPHLLFYGKRRGSVLSVEASELIQHADTFFVASAHPECGVDVSHRGGPPGFVQILDYQTLRIPDYVGNSMFNTLGNLYVSPNAGLVFVDFERCNLLQLTGQARLHLGTEKLVSESDGTGDAGISSSNIG